MKASYANLKTKLDDIIGKIQDSNTDLDEALILHEEGQKVLEKLHTYLGDAKQKISQKKQAK